MSRCTNFITTRQELCDRLIYLKEHKDVKLKDVLPSVFKLSQKRISDVENPEIDCKLSDVMLYLQMCNSCMELSLYDNDFVDDIDELRRFIKEAQRDVELSVVSIAKKVRISSNVIDKFLYNKGSLSVNQFLSIINAMGIILEI